MLFEAQIVLCMLVILCFSVFFAMLAAVAISSNTNLVAIGRCVYVNAIFLLNCEEYYLQAWGLEFLTPCFRSTCYW